MIQESNIINIILIYNKLNFKILILRMINKQESVFNERVHRYIIEGSFRKIKTDSILTSYLISSIFPIILDNASLRFSSGTIIL
jgi:hypothetical protein